MWIFQAKVDGLESRFATLSRPNSDGSKLWTTREGSTVGEANALTRESRNTIRKRIAGLVAKRFLALVGNGRAAGYRKC